jgi:hypothetical protein
MIIESRIIDGVLFDKEKILHIFLEIIPIIEWLIIVGINIL